MKWLCVSFIIVIVPYHGRANEQANRVDADPFDLSQSEMQVKELGIPTISSVEALEKKAATLYQQKDWKAAADANAQFAKAANWLANIIVAGLRPYYGANYDERKKFTRASELLPYESKANALRRKRDRAIVIQAECESNLGNKEGAVALLMTALKVIDIKDTECWEKARTLLYSISEVNAD